VRRTGVAAGLLAAALDSVPGRAVLLEVAEGNDAAIALYRAAGFGEISRRRGYYGDADALIMRLIGQDNDG
jgi:ribosomal-protein-alanine N-acetyltransferase